MRIPCELVFRPLSEVRSGRPAVFPPPGSQTFWSYESPLRNTRHTTGEDRLIYNDVMGHHIPSFNRPCRGSAETGPARPIRRSSVIITAKTELITEVLMPLWSCEYSTPLYGTKETLVGGSFARLARFRVDPGLPVAARSQRSFTAWYDSDMRP